MQFCLSGLTFEGQKPILRNLTTKCTIKKRLHASLGYVPSAEFEETHLQQSRV
jgi:hypothetical protein